VAFSEPIKKEARRRSNFICAFCHGRGFMEVHHLVPESLDGPDTIENACPLCPTCHNDYGDNPGKRLQLREMRDTLWETNEKNSFPAERILTEGFERIQERIDAGIVKQSQLYSELKELFLSFHATSMETINAAGTIGELTRVADIVAVPLERESKAFVLDVLLPEGRIIDLDEFKALFRSLAGREGDIATVHFDNPNGRNWVVKVEYKRPLRSVRIDGLKLSLEREGYRVLRVTAE